MDDLVTRDGIHYKKFSDVPFTGKVNGNYQGFLRNGRIVGPWLHFDINGQLSWKGSFNDNGKREGAWIELRVTLPFSKGGKVENWHEGSYKNGEKEGYWHEYYLTISSDGTTLKKTTEPAFTGTYKDGRKISD